MTTTEHPLHAATMALYSAATLAATAAAAATGDDARLEAMDLALGIELAHAQALSLAAAAGPLNASSQPTGTTLVELLRDAEEATASVPIELHPKLSQLLVDVADLRGQAEIRERS